MTSATKPSKSEFKQSVSTLENLQNSNRSQSNDSVENSKKNNYPYLDTTQNQGDGKESTLDFKQSQPKNQQISKRSQPNDPYDFVEDLKKINDPYLETTQIQGEGNELAPEMYQSVVEGSEIIQQIFSFTIQIDRLRQDHLSLIQKFQLDYPQKPNQQQLNKPVEDEM